MRVFLSHQQRDSVTAQRVQQRLATLHGISSYLDITDRLSGMPIGELADHIRSKMNGCTHLLAIVSPNTPLSQWVPWEIGVATEKDFPLASFCQETPPPEFLTKWPYLRSDLDLDRYVRAIRSQEATFNLEARLRSVVDARRSGVAQFYRSLKSDLGQ